MPACPYCAENVAAGAAVCPHCNMPLRGRTTGGAPASSGGGSSGSKVLLIVLGVSVVVLLVCGGVLLALLLPAVQAGREAARRSHSMNNLKQIGLAVHNYHDVFNTFPPGGIFDEEGRGHHGWQTSLLPFVEQAPLYNRIDFHRPWDDPANAATFQTEVSTYLNPNVPERRSVDGFGLSHYAGNSQAFGPNSSLKLREVTDGTSNTMLAGEAAGDFKPWGHPENVRDPALGINQGPGSFGRPGSNQSMILMMDGSTRVIDGSIDPAVLKAIATPAGGESVPAF